MPESLFDVTLQIGEVLRCEPFPETRKPDMLKLWIDLGDREVQSCAQLAHHYEPKELVGRQVLCATDLGTVNIAGFTSEVLTTGVDDEEGHPVLLAPDRPVPTGAILH